MLDHEAAAEGQLTLIARCVYLIASSTYSPCRSTNPIGCALLFSVGSGNAGLYQHNSSTILRGPIS